jgi:RimJ/RimL family protein N-acetyltransferase
LNVTSRLPGGFRFCGGSPGEAAYLENFSMAGDLTIRRLVLADAEGFRDAVAKVRAERRYILPGLPLPLEKARAFVLDTVKHGYPMFVLDHDGRLVGWCDILPARDNEATRHVGVLGMGLLGEYRGQGFGKRLINDALTAARAFGFSRVELSVFATNARAIALYRQVGFVEEGVRRGYARIDGVIIDSIMMAILDD